MKDETFSSLIQKQICCSCNDKIMLNYSQFCISYAAFSILIAHTMGYVCFSFLYQWNDKLIENSKKTKKTEHVVPLKLR